MPQFKRSFPYDELRLTNNAIRHLPSSALDHIKTIKRINLEHNALGSIDPDLFRLVGNYLEELILSGDEHIHSLEFLTRYPLKKLRVLKLDRFNLSDVDLQKTFVNMTKLESLSLRSCRLTQMPRLDHVVNIDLEGNFFTDTLFLSSSYSQVNLAHNQLGSIILQHNPQLTTLNLSHNHLTEFYSLSKFNAKLKRLDLSANQLSTIDWTMFGENLTHLNLTDNQLVKVNLNALPRHLLDLSVSKNTLRQIVFPKVAVALKSLDLSINHLKTLEKNGLIHQLTAFNLSQNPLQCNCQLQWLKDHLRQPTTFDASSWTCASPNSSFLTAQLKCQSMLMPRVTTFNITYVSSASHTGLFIQWALTDDYHTTRYLQFSLEQPYRLSRRFSSNQTFAFLDDPIQVNRHYHLCLIVVHRFARDRYCREVRTERPTALSIDPIQWQANEIVFDEPPETTGNTSPAWNDFTENSFRLMLIGSCVGGLITLVLLFTGCYLCYQVHRYRSPGSSASTPQPIAYQKCSTNRSDHFHYPVSYPYSTCPHHQRIYHSENLSNSTDSTQMDLSLSTTGTGTTTKHIYQTIDNQDYCSLTRPDKHLFDLWNESVRQKS